MKLMSIRTVVFLAILGYHHAQAQSYTIADGYVAACSGTLFDSGAEGGSGYGNNENYTLIICPDGPGGPAISLEWVTFDLSTEGELPIDRMAIYDGFFDVVNPDPPLIGIFDGNNPPSITSASFANVQNTFNGGGCLTLVYTSNEVGIGHFSAEINCHTPCEPPTASANVGGAIPLYVCQGETITFDGTASTAASPFTIVEYNWDFDNGETDNSGPIVAHNFDEPGEYIVQLYLTDDNDCVNVNSTDLLIHVNAAPNASASASTTYICQGDSITFDGTASTAASPFSIAEYNWVFEDGVTDNSGPIVTHLFSDAGEYAVQLYVTDDFSCLSMNDIELSIVVLDSLVNDCDLITRLEPSSNNSIQVYPVPSADEVIVRGVGKNVNYSLMDARGRVLQQRMGFYQNGSIRIGVRDLPVGLYILELFGESPIYMRVVKE